jgi:glycosyltransferase involved in cell wall biosynthesis
MGKKVLIGSPVRQTPEILDLFLRSLGNLDDADLEIDYYFVDDNDEGKSSAALINFRVQTKAGSSVMIEKGRKNEAQYVRNERTHFWDDRLIWLVASYKDKIIEYCLAHHYDYLFLVDSDLLLHPQTLATLIAAGKDIISEVFWTKWQQNSPELPQVWLYDQYDLYRHARGEKLGQQEVDCRYKSFLEQLRIPGIYEVGGLGACTLISQRALAKGVNFSEIYNLTFWGEDRHFCLRAAALGFKLYADTHYPAYHIYRTSDLAGAVAYYKRNIDEDITLAIQGKNAGQDKEIVTWIREFVKTFYGCDYRNVTGDEGFSYLSAAHINKLTLKKEANRKWLIQNKITSTVVSGKPEVATQTDGKIKITLPLTLVVSVGSQQGTVSCQGSFTLIKSEQSGWLVDDLRFLYPDGSEAMGISLVELLQYKRRRNKAKGNKLTLMMLVRNEADKMLKRTLCHAAAYIDAAVILDDASTDDTVAVCREVLKGKPLTIVSNQHHGFSNEINLRKQLWQLTIQTDPDWILALDADEIFEDNIVQYIRQLIDQPDFDYYAFRLYDMWDETHYREDTFWQAHKIYRVFLTRYQPDFEYLWYEASQHCGRLPYNIFSLPGCQCYVRLKHYGWATPGLREEKYKRYLALDPEGKFGSIDQYRTILSPDPILREWK